MFAFWDCLVSAVGLSSAGFVRKGLMSDLDAGDFRTLAKSVDSKVLNMQGYAVSPESILARKSGIIPNNNNELLFKGVTMRSFSFVFKMSPRSSDEGSAIRKDYQMVSNFYGNEKKATGGAEVQMWQGGTSFFLGTPHVFEMKFMTNINGKVVENPSVGMMKPMALKKVWM